MESRIKQLREKRGLIQEILAAELGITQQMLSKYEKDVTLIKVDILKKIAAYFNVTTDYLLGVSDVKRDLQRQMKMNETLDEFYDLVEVYKELDCYDKEMIWSIIQTIKKTTIVTFVSVMTAYEGEFWNKCIFAFVFNAIWMMIETLSGYVLLSYCNRFTHLQVFGILGSFISKLIFLVLIFALKKVLMNDEIKELSVKYSVMLVLIPTGSIYVMNEIFLFSYKIDSNRANFHSAIAAIILLCMNVLIFYIYMKLTDDLRLKRMNAVYEQQLELCERHQQEREISTLQLRDVRHNMKNNLVSILAYAENKECEKIIGFVNEIMEEGGVTISTITNSGNIVIDSLIGYWYVTAKNKGIDFTVTISIPMKMPFKGADICLILGNLLENAVEAAEKVNGKRKILLRCP